ncbi:MAG: ATP-dependent Clp protease ATP-binding subunit [Patescibacteria group bacterium]
MDFQKSKIRTKAHIYKLASFWPFKICIFLFYLVSLLSLALVILKYFNLIILEKIEFLIFSFLALAGFLFLSFHIYYKGEIKNPRQAKTLKEALKEKKNLADFLTIEGYLSIKRALKLNETKLPICDHKALILALLQNKKAMMILPRFGIKPDNFIAQLEKQYPRGRTLRDEEMEDLDKFIEKAAYVAKAEFHPKIEISDLLAVLALGDPFFSKTLFDLNLKPDDVINITYWTFVIYREKELKKFNPDHLKLTGGIGRDWGAGYTPYLSRAAEDLTEAVLKFKYPLHLIGHQREIVALGKILVRAMHHNVLLIGEPGVGKETIVLGLSKIISGGRAQKILRHRHIMKLDLDVILAGAESSGEIVQRLDAIFTDAVRAGNIILFIDHIEALFGGGIARIGTVDASQVIIPFLEHPDLYFIGTTTLEDFHQHIETKAGIVDKFERIEVKEPEKSVVIRVLQDLSPVIETRSRVIFSYESLKTIVDLADQYIYNKYFPEKAVDLLDEVAVSAAREGRGVLVMPRHVEQVMRQKVSAPIGEAAFEERERLLKLEEILHKRVIGQDEAVNLVADAMRRARAGVGAEKKPIGSFLFLGPTGVGKTETCKALAEAYFGNENAMIRFDMSEYQDIASIHRLIGAPPGTRGAEAGGLLTNVVKDKPFSLVLFDEIEKAHPDILNLFLQVLDEGWLTDSLARKVKFNNTIIIGTSNAGAQLISECVKQNIPFEKMKKSLWDYLIQKGIFRPEFLNRFSAVVTFKPLTEQEVVQICSLLLKKLANKLEEEKGIFLEVTPQATVKLAKLGFDPMLGARPIQRVIEKKVEDVLAKRMLEGKIGRGSRIVVREEDII